MHCPKCLNYVPYGAKYCRSCGEAIPEEERKTAYSKTLWGKLQRAEDWYKTLALKKVTGSIVFKLILLVLILAIGIVNVIRNGTELKILDSDAYDVQYNTAQEEYYILTDAEEVVLNLYVPNKAETLLLTGYGGDGSILLEHTVTTADLESGEALLVRRDAYAYLTLDAMQNNTCTSQLKFLVLSQQ